MMLKCINIHKALRTAFAHRKKKLIVTIITVLKTVRNLIVK